VDNAGAAEALIKRRANVNRLANNNITPLYWQIQNGHAEVVRVLLEKRANYRERLKEGKTLLHFAADRNDPEIVGLLIKKGLSVNSVDKIRATPLHYAVYKDRPGVAEVLLKNGANPNLKLSSEAAVITYGASNLPSERAVGGFTPLALAESEEMKALLRQHGAR
jgi:ankyrin repeat protein